MDISLTIVRAIVYLVILCVQGFRLRRKNKNLNNRLPAKKAQNACRAVVWAGGTFFPVVLLCQFLVLAGNGFWLYILLCTWSTIQLLCCVSYFWFWWEIVFGVTYVLSVQYSCAVVSVFLLWRESFITTGKKSSSHLSGGCAITTIATTGPIYAKSSDFYAKLNVSNLNVTNLY